VLGRWRSSSRWGWPRLPRMISEGVVAVIGTYGSSVTEPAQLIYEDAGLLNIAYGATAESLTQRGYRYFFRTSFRDDRQGDYFAELVATKLNLRRVAIVHDNTTFARGLAEAARRSLARYPGVQVVFYDAITPGDRDFTAVISRLRAQNPDVVYFTAYYPEAGLFLRQMRDAGVQALFVGGNAAINAEFVEIAGLALAKGSLVTQEPMPTDLEYPEAQAFLAEYVARHGAPPPTGPTSSKPAASPCRVPRPSCARTRKYSKHTWAAARKGGQGRCAEHPPCVPGSLPVAHPARPHAGLRFVLFVRISLFERCLLMPPGVE
ncbi:MAG: branched-chain amino acid ABC transporter substrate-binding protein, partial [Limnochordales bacterium]